MQLDTEQPMPVPNSAPSVQGMVRDDLLVREQLGREKYGTALQPHNGRDALRDAYEEALDLCCYLRQAIAERDSAAQNPASIDWDAVSLEHLAVRDPQGFEKALNRLAMRTALRTLQ